MRTTFKLGAPLNINGTRFLNKGDRGKEQDAYVENFLNEL